MTTAPTNQGAHARVAIVTGAGSGIGAAIARGLGESGWRLVLAGRRRDRLEATADGLEAAVVPGDVRSEELAESLVGAAIDRFGRLDALALNAGVALAGAVADTTTETWHHVVDTNLTGPFLLCRAALPHLIQAKGSVVAIGSIAARVSGPNLAVYGVAKAGLARLIESIAVDYAPHGVRANTVNPGWVRTEMADEELGELVGTLGDDLDAVYRQVVRHVPARRPGTPTEVAAAVAWLLSSEASYVNGANITVDGGTSIVDVGMLAFDGSDVRDPKLSS